MKRSELIKLLKKNGIIMAKYLYPAIFTKENEMYNVSFPDIPGCNTFGSNLQEAYDMAEDALCLMLYSMEEDGDEIPTASDITKLKHKSNEIITLISCDTISYREKNDKRLVNKTVTIEYWLNKMAEKANLNCSRLLRKAIREELGI